MGRGRKHGWKRGLKGQSPRQPSKAIPGEGVATDGASLGVLGEEAPEQHKFSPEEVSTWLAATLGSNHVRNRVGGMSIVGGYASGNGSRKLTQQEISRGSCFGAIASKGENEHVNEANLVGMAPWLVGKSSGHSDGPPKPVVERGPTTRNAKV